jgi:hypothetical protein
MHFVMGRRILMYIFFEYAACLFLVAIVATLLFAVCALLIILKEEPTILGRLARGVAHDARVLVARQAELIRSGLSVVGFGPKPSMASVRTSDDR